MKDIFKVGAFWAAGIISIGAIIALTISLTVIGIPLLIGGVMYLVYRVSKEV